MSRFDEEYRNEIEKGLQTAFKGKEMQAFREATRKLGAMNEKARQNMIEFLPAMGQLREQFSRIAEYAARTFDGVGAAIEQLGEAISKIVLDGTIDAFETLVKLAPYMLKEIEAHPEEYDLDQPIQPALIAAAARMARADGVDIPPLRAEEPRAEQLQFVWEESETGEVGKTAIIEVAKKIPVLEALRYVIPNTPFVNAMQESGLINAGPKQLVVANKPEITAYTVIDYEPEVAGITITDPRMTEFERTVSNAVCSLWVAAERQGVEPVFTTDSIYRAMPGGGEVASPQQRGAITKAVEKLRRIHMTIDATEELTNRHTVKQESPFTVFDEYYFQMIRAMRSPRNSLREVAAYKLTAKPVMLKYAEITGQLITVPTKYLDIKKIDKNGIVSREPIAMTADRQAITSYMLRRIAIMKHDLEAARDKLKYYEKRRKAHPELDLPAKTLSAFRKQSNTILFETIFSVTDTQTGSRTQQQRDRELCYKVLDFWKAMGFIKDYTQQSKGRKITGINITI